MSEAVQHAAAVALTDEREFPREISEVYARRRDLLAEGLETIGLEVNAPRATPYFWVRVPEGHTSASFTELDARPGLGARLAREMRTVRAARATSGSR